MKLKHAARLPSSLVSRLPLLLTSTAMKLVAANQNQGRAPSHGFPGLEAFEPVGDNWRVPGCDKPIAFFWGEPPQSKPLIALHLENHRVAFPQEKMKWRALAKGLSRQDRRNIVFIVSHPGAHPRALRHARWHGIPVRYLAAGPLQDGAMAQPLSLAWDEKNAYYNPGRPSDLETLLQTYDFSSDGALMARAAFCIEKLKSLRPPHAAKPAAGTEKRILVIGQSPDDPALVFARKSPVRCVDAVRLAREENPDARIFYRPHPQALELPRDHRHSPARVEDICERLPAGAGAAWPENIDHVYTVSSPEGFEAVLRGITVTTLGAPWYAGWGLTDDRVKIKRRKRKLAAEEAFAGAYLLYAKYICPASGTALTAEQALAHLHLMLHPRLRRGMDYVDMPLDLDLARDSARTPAHTAKDSEQWMLSTLRQYPTGRILADLYEEKPPARALEDALEQLPLESGLLLFPRLTTHLVRLVLFTELRNALDIYTPWFNRRGKDISPEMALKFLEQFTNISHLLNGRRVAHVPEYTIPPLTESSLHDRLACAQVKAYCKLLQYDKAEALMRDLTLRNGGAWLALASTFRERPAHSERGAYHRHALQRQAADKALGILEQEYGGALNNKVNRIFYHWGLQEEDEMAAAVESLLGGFPRMWKDRKSLPDYILMWLERIPALSLLPRMRGLAGPFFTLVKSKRLDIAERWLHFASPVLRRRTLKLAQLAILQSAGRFEDVTHIAALHPQLLESRKIGHIYSNALYAQGHFAEALHQFRKARKAKDHHTLLPETQPVTERYEERCIFLNHASQIINSVPQPDSPKGVIFLSTLRCYNSIAILAPILVELKKRGYAVVHPAAGMLHNQPTGIRAVDDIAGAIMADHHDGRILLEWKIDWNNRVLECQGINYYHGVYERLAIAFRVFHVDINRPDVARYFRDTLIRMDFMVRICNRMQALAEQGIPVISVNSNNHAAPFSVFRDYALGVRHPLHRLVCLSIAYENYYTNLGGKYSGSMAVVDMTLHRNCRQPFLAIPERFEKWYAANKDSPEVEEKVKKLLGANRSQADASAVSPSLARIRAARAEGKRVIACLGKIPCDLGVPYDGGPAHADMGDWINHTISTLANDENTLLVIKPHPHEIRPEIARDLVEPFRKIIPETLPANALFLGHNECNMPDLAPHLDLAILWNGTSALELTAMGVPVTMCSWFGRHDYPVELIYPENRAQYERFLGQKSYPKPTAELGRKAMALLHYMGTKEVALPNEYSLRQVTNDPTGTPVWNAPKIARFLREGDPYVSIAADRVLEGLLHEQEKARQEKTRSEEKNVQR